MSAAEAQAVVAEPVYDLQVVGEVAVAPSWQQTRTHKPAEAQTEQVEGSEAAAQTVVSALSVAEQLDKEVGVALKATVPAAEIEGMQYVYRGPHFQEEAVLQFLNQVKDDVVEQLHANIKSTAFDRYEANWSEKVENITLQLTLLPRFALETEWHVTGMSWNASGNTLAAGYGRIDTVSWCPSKGYVTVWNVARRDLDTGNPTLLLETDSHVTAVSFHPVQPSLLAAGTYNGEVLVWNLAEERARPQSTTGGPSSPREPIAKLQWLQNVHQAGDAALRFILCSASQDGKLMFWSPARLAEPLSAYEVQTKRRQLAGVQSMSFARSGAAAGRASVPGVDNLLLLGVESGDVFRTKPGITAAAAKTRTAAAQPTAGLSVLEVDGFEGHRGPVNGVDCSPFFRNLFLTCSSDGSLRFYSTLERSPLLSIEPSMETRHFLYAAQFSPFRAAVVATASRSSHMHIYDLEKSRSKPVAAVEAGTDGVPVLSVQFNQVQPSLIASGDMKGAVKVWQLSSELSQPTELERAAVRRSEGTAGKQGQPQGQQEQDSGNNANPVRQLLGFML